MSRRAKDKNLLKNEELKMVKKIESEKVEIPLVKNLKCFLYNKQNSSKFSFVNFIIFNSSTGLSMYYTANVFKKVIKVPFINN